MKVYVCDECARPTLWADDRCCSGFVSEVEYVPADQQDAVEALRAIHAEGKVCAEYEVCEHRACRSSYAAWAIADRYFGSHS
jgi:hypothetical protein